MRAGRSRRRPPWGFVALFVGGVAVMTAFAVVAIAAGPPGGTATASTDFAAGIGATSASLLELQKGDGRAAPDFHLTDQYGRPMSLAEFAGRPVVLTFNDDECADLCTLLAEDVVQADRDLGSARDSIAFVSINANPYHPAAADVASWTDDHGLGHLPNWYFGTGDAATLARVAADYGVRIELDAATQSVVHGTEIFFIDPKGRKAAVGQFGTDSANTAPFAHAMAQMAMDLQPTEIRTAVAGSDLGVPRADGTAIGSQPAGFSLPLLTDPAKKAGTAADRGRYTVVNFWSSSCTACRSEMPDIQQEFLLLGSKAAFVGVDVADPAPAASAFATAAGAGYPLVADADGRVAGRFQVTGLPFTVILDPQGRILIRHAGRMTREQLDYLLRSIDPELPPAG